MGRIVVSEFVTLDGVFEDPGGASDFEHGGWAFKADRGEAGNAFKSDELRDAEAQLLGRVTYEGFAQAWPNMGGDWFGDKMNSMPKYVVSRTLESADWTNSTVLRGELREEVEKLKQSLDGDILVAGSGQLVHGLFEHDLIDELRLMVYPAILGSGRRLLDGAGPVNLRLTEVGQAGETFTLVYQRAD